MRESTESLSASTFTFFIRHLHCLASFTIRALYYIVRRCILVNPRDLSSPIVTAFRLLPHKIFPLTSESLRIYSHILSDWSIALLGHPFVSFPAVVPATSWSKGMWSTLGCWCAPDIGMSCSDVKSFFCVVLCSSSLLFLYIAGCQGESAEDWRRLFVHSIGIVVREFYPSFFTSFSANSYHDHPLWFSCAVILGRYCILFSAVDICRDSFAS
jgi:hypothetical protein